MFWILRFENPTSKVVHKKAFDAKSRGRSKNEVKNWVKLHYTYGSTQEWKFNSVKKYFEYSYLNNGSTQEW